MNWQLDISSAAEDEFNEAVDWFEGTGIGRGVEFARVVNDALNRVLKNPYMHQEVFGKVRRRVLPKKYLYVIYYIPEGQAVRIISILHTSRDPTIWQSRA